MQTAKEIQRTVQRKLMERVHEEERLAKTQAMKIRPQLIAAKPAANESSDNRRSSTPEKNNKTPSSSDKVDMFAEKERSRSRSRSRKKSKSVDSEKFMSPKRKEKSVTPEKEWSN